VLVSKYADQELARQVCEDLEDWLPGPSPQHSSNYA